MDPFFEYAPPTTAHVLAAREAIYEALRDGTHCSRCGHSVLLPEIRETINDEPGVFRSAVETLYWHCSADNHTGAERVDLRRVLVLCVRRLTLVGETQSLLHAALGVDPLEFSSTLDSVCRAGLLLRPTPNWVQPVLL